MASEFADKQHTGNITCTRTGGYAHFRPLLVGHVRFDRFPIFILGTNTHLETEKQPAVIENFVEVFCTYLVCA